MPDLGRNERWRLCGNRAGDSGHDQGLLLGLACPFTLAFMLEMLPQLVPVSDVGASDVLVVSVAMTMATALPLVAMVFATTRLRGVIDRYTPALCRATAAMLVCFAVISLVGAI